jgi:transcriptional regulator GlxA family with amidase domain
LRGPLCLAPTLDVSRGRGRSWARLVRLLAHDAHNRDGLVSHPLIGPRLREDLVRGLLVATDHQYQDRLAQPDRIAGSKPVRRAVQAIHDAPESPYTLGQLAEVAGVSTRSLQEGFRRYVGTSPTAYLREVRLARAHEDLRRMDHAATSVAEVAHRWGFLHLGRFAAHYRAKYGVSPSRTLRDG